jgi:hypothetical protein
MQLISRAPHAVDIGRISCRTSPAVVRSLSVRGVGDIEWVSLASLGTCAGRLDARPVEAVGGMVASAAPW